jgi:hypothetical protein
MNGFAFCLQASLREKTKQMKSLASELDMYQAQVGGQKHGCGKQASEKLLRSCG